MKEDVQEKPGDDKAPQQHLVERGGVQHYNKALAPLGENDGNVAVQGDNFCSQQEKAQTDQATTAMDMFGQMGPVDALGQAFFNMQMFRLSESSEDGAARNAQEVLSLPTSQPNSPESSHRGPSSTGKHRRPGSNVHKVGRRIFRNFGVVYEEEEEEE
ncbi:unnamed protein product [Caenorhabditis brenneri]